MVTDATTSPGSQALLVVDVQNTFCHPEGSFARMGYDMSGCIAAVPGCARLVAAARAAGVLVVFVTYAYRPDYSDGGYLVAQMHPEVVEHAAMASGTWDVQVVDELAPRPDELHVVKNRYSAFIGTDLDQQLRGLGVAAVTVCGVTTNVCVEGTARDAAQRDFRVTVVEDATGEIERARHHSSLATVRHALGRVSTIAEVTAGWQAVRGGQPA